MKTKSLELTENELNELVAKVYNELEDKGDKRNENIYNVFNKLMDLNPRDKSKFIEKQNSRSVKRKTKDEIRKQIEEDAAHFGFFTWKWVGVKPYNKYRTLTRAGIDTFEIIDEFRQKGWNVDYGLFKEFEAIHSGVHPYDEVFYMTFISDCKPNSKKQQLIQEKYKGIAINFYFSVNGESTYVCWTNMCGIDLMIEILDWKAFEVIDNPISLKQQDCYHYAYRKFSNDDQIFASADGKYTFVVIDPTEIYKVERYCDDDSEECDEFEYELFNLSPNESNYLEGIFNLLKKKNKLSDLMTAICMNLNDWSIHLINSKNQDLNVVDNNGRTALYYAIKLKQLNVIKTLLENGASIDFEINQVSAKKVLMDMLKDNDNLSRYGSSFIDYIKRSIL